MERIARAALSKPQSRATGMVGMDAGSHTQAREPLKAPISRHWNDGERLILLEARVGIEGMPRVERLQAIENTICSKRQNR